MARPPGFPFSINSAVDKLLKQEFDLHRSNGTAHPLITKYGVDAKPVFHEQLDIWRNNFQGIEYHHKPTNFIITGAIDDLWQNSKGEYIVVDYKATSKDEEITALDKDWHDGYKRQMEVYQWLLRKNGYPVSNTGYFVYCNGKSDAHAFDAKIEFDVTLIPYEGNDSWVEPAILNIYQCLQSNIIPSFGAECDYCSYRNAATEVTK
ncbi:MAG TPA: PD-(D/E)XK nuclease family protein [Thermodesulfobacteriota bacterium]|nr:PD-(D/E)XK nuclease family protein [Thermodesulfobacteriota bacterium]